MWLRIVTALYIVAITVLSVVKLSELPKTIDVVGVDKVVHLLFYLILTLLLLANLLKRSTTELSFKRCVIVAIVSASYGVTMEVIQHFTGRECSLYDIAANTIGAGVALMLFRIKSIRSLMDSAIND